MIGVLIRRGNLDTQRDTRDVCAQRKGQVRTKKKTAIFKPRKETSEETNPADTLILDFQSNFIARTMRK